MRTGWSYCGTKVLVRHGFLARNESTPPGYLLPPRSDLGDCQEQGPTAGDTDGRLREVQPSR
jgi:hypothetical protein